MNKENAKEFLPLIQAMAEGKTIQTDYPDGIWRDTGWIETIDNDGSLYRIKPDPRTFAMYRRKSTGTMVTTENFNAVNYPYNDGYWERITVLEVLQ